jgi:hypothetical protein
MRIFSLASSPMRLWLWWQPCRGGVHADIAQQLRAQFFNTLELDLFRHSLQSLFHMQFL